MRMLIVSANVANLQLARSVMRQKEMAIRAAIDAGRRRLIRQLLTENVVLSLCGGLLGVILAVGGTRPLTGLRAFNIPLLSMVRMDVASLVFSVLLAEMKQRNPNWGCPRIAQQIALAFNIQIEKDVVRRILAHHYMPGQDSDGPLG
jgi:hypothetical protein